MSVSAPAANANSTIGNEVAACTSDTITGEGDRSVITQADDTPLIHVPMLEPSAANQNALNGSILSGAHVPERPPLDTSLPACLVTSENPGLS